MAKPRTEIEADAEKQVASMLKINRESIPKLAVMRTLTEENPGMSLTERAQKSGVSYNQAKRWHKKGLLDPNNYRLALTIAQRLGPEMNQIIAENAAGLVVESQRQVLKKLPEATAKEASSIAVQQQQIAHLASGQATARVEFTTREEVIAEMRDIGLIPKAQPEIEVEVIDGEVVEETATSEKTPLD